MATASQMPALSSSCSVYRLYGHRRPAESCRKNMERAIRESGLGSVENNSVDNLFVVSEPEAAAAYVLASTTAVLVS